MYKLMVKVQEIKADHIGTKLPHKKTLKKHFASSVAAPPPTPKSHNVHIGSKRAIMPTKHKNK